MVGKSAIFREKFDGRKKTEKLIILIDLNREVAIRVFDFNFFSAHPPARAGIVLGMHLWRTTML